MVPLALRPCDASCLVHSGPGPLQVLTLRNALDNEHENRAILEERLKSAFMKGPCMPSPVCLPPVPRPLPSPKATLHAALSRRERGGRWSNDQNLQPANS